MIATDKFVFVHMHKCGGTFINLFIRKFFPVAREIGYHYPISMLPTEYRHLPVLGTVRNPWEFYVSYYMFQMDLLKRARAAMAILTAEERARLWAGSVDPLNGVDALFAYLSNDGALDFAATLDRFLNLANSDSLLHDALACMPTQYGRRGPDTPIQQSGFRGMGLLRQELAEISGRGIGFYSFLFERMYGEGAAYIVPTTRLREGLLEFLAHASVEITPEMARYVMEHHPENTSEHAHYAAYYSPQLKQRVQSQESMLIQRYGFEFQQMPESTAR